MRFLGLDYGTKRVGLALSDETGFLAYPHVVLKNNAKLLANLLAIIEREQVGTVVIGDSLDYRRQPNSIMKRARQLAERLRGAGVQIVFHDEVLTTQEAAREAEQKDELDSRAAAIILNNYLEKLHHQ